MEQGPKQRYGMTRATSQSVNLFETGLYTVGDVAHLTKINATRVRRWIAGYSYRSSGKSKSQPPVWEPEIPTIDGVLTLSFNDLLEVRWVDIFRKAGVLLPNIRNAITELRDIYGVKYPFSTERVFADGMAIMIELEDEAGKKFFYEVSGSRNYGFWEVLVQNLKVGYVFNEGIAEKWHPDENEFGRIVVDPAVAFGRPVVEGTRLDTGVLASAYAAEQSFDLVGEWYGIDSDAVQQAVSFHRQLKAA